MLYNNLILNLQLNTVKYVFKTYSILKVVSVFFITYIHYFFHTQKTFDSSQRLVFELKVAADFLWGYNRRQQTFSGAKVEDSRLSLGLQSKAADFLWGYSPMQQTFSWARVQGSRLSLGLQSKAADFLWGFS